VTGLSERPSGKPHETRTAEHVDFRSPSADWRAGLKALQRAERHQLQAAHAAGHAMLRASDMGKATALAHAEIALAFAHRWAEIRRGPAALRAAAAAALQSEQAAALSSRVTYLLSQTADQQKAQRTQLSSRQKAERRALSCRHREQWTAAAGVVAGPRARPLQAKISPISQRLISGLLP
jgi:hypothetical protein